MTETVKDVASVPTTEELVERAAALRPLLEANTAETERERRVVQANVEAIRDAGLCRLMVPRRFGGYELDVRTQLLVMRELAKGCGSTSWAMSLINVCAWLTGLYSERAQAEVWGEGADGGWAAGSLAPHGRAQKVEGGMVVHGRWAWSSGCLHAQWGVGGVQVVDEAGETVDFGLALMPMSDLAIEDTWFVTGMRGTGSNTIVADGAFVPDHRLLSYGGAFEGRYATEHADETLYRSAFVPVTILILVGPLLGLAAAAAELVTEKASARGITYTHYEKQIDSAGFQTQLAEASLLADEAHFHAFRAADDIDAYAARGEHPEVLARARMRMDAAHAAKLSREAVDLLVSAHGTSSFAEASPLQRIWRDVSVGSRHAIIGWTPNLEIYGKALLGVEPNITDLL
jgi:alkylation response protein AidB-like acyl-CoA dehydrogenase